MKVLISILFSISIFASSPNCLKRVCIGDQVMDQFGWSGTVQSFSVEKDELYVSSPIDGSVHPFPYEGTGKKVRCFESICEEDIMTWHNQYEVEVYGIYDNGMVTIWEILGATMFVTRASTLSK